jgi:hypothetical protein
VPLATHANGQTRGPAGHRRYLTEDVGYSLVFLADLARHLSVPTPTMDAVIRIGSIVAGQAFCPGR